jgi:hypothetical protein
MPLADAIRKHGFRRWYERQLYEGFACLVTGFLALIMMAIALEVIDVDGSKTALFQLLLIAAIGGSLCAAAWARFHRCLARAEHLASQAVCPACDAYGKFAVLTARSADDAFEQCALGVQCRNCAREWTIA